MPYGDAIRSLVRRSRFLYGILEPLNRKIITARWQRNGTPIPPPSSVKRDILQRTARKYHLRVLVETGTFKADTVMALRRDFHRIVSVELSPVLYGKAARRTRHERNVELLQGNSTEMLPSILSTLSEPALFWLDAHYSGGVTAKGDTVSPISSELDLVLGHVVRGHVVLVDDAREFHNSAISGYPGPEVVSAAARQHNYAISEQNDIFFLVPNDLWS